MKRNTRKTIHLRQLSSPLRDAIIALATVVPTFWLMSLQFPKARLLVLPVLIAIGAALFLALLQSRRARHEIPTLGTLEDLSENIGVSAEELETLALKHGIAPQYKVGNVRYYNPADFSDSARLLRPSGVTAELLRPAESRPLQATDLLISVNKSASAEES